MMSLNNFNKSSCFSAIIDPSDPYENYPDKKNEQKKSTLVAASSPCVSVWIAK